MIAKVRFSFIIGFCLVMIASFSVCAQISTYEAQVQRAITEMGIPESELRQALDKIGIDYDKLDELTPLQVRALQATMTELREKRFQTNGMSPINISGDSIDMKREGFLIDSLQRIDEQDTLLRKAAIYGHELFFNNAIGLIPYESNFIPSEEYVLDVGDQLVISIYAGQAIDQNYVIESDGNIGLSIDGRSIGRVYLAGLTISEARDKLIRTLSRRYNRNQISVQFKSARTIRVSLRGEVLRPGDYVVSAINSAINIIGEAGGMTDQASVRNITVLHSDGKIERIDLYNLLKTENRQNSTWLRNGDIILVPSARSIVVVDGAITRPHNYELMDGEGIKDLVSFAGGLRRDAYRKDFQLTRFTDDSKILKDIPYSSLISQSSEFLLVHGDSVYVHRIKDIVEDYVIIRGQVLKEGEYELTPGMTLKQLVEKSGLTRNSRTDFANLKRKDKDGYTSMIAVSIDNALSNVMPEAGLRLESGDELTVWSTERFVDVKEVKIDGAVRYPESVVYDERGNFRVMDLIEYVGGLRRDAASFAHVIRLDPLKPNERMYIRIDLNRAIADKQSADNFVLAPFDSLYIYSQNDFLEEALVSVDGAVINPGSFAYGEGLTLRDVLILAGGFRRSSATNNIEVSRILVTDNQPTKTIIHRLSMERTNLFQDNAHDPAANFVLEPYDNIFVRFVPEFRLQSTVYIEGEVINPGPYSLVETNERVLDIIKRAGGLTDEAFSAGATFYRTKDSLGYVLLELDELINNPSSKFNYVLADGDRIIIPKLREFVTISGATQYLAQNPEQKTITVPYYAGKSVKYYIDTHAGGFADNARKDKIFVLYPNGGVAATVSKFPFGKRHPDVLPGSTIQVGFEKATARKEDGNNNTNLTKVLGDSVAQAMSILTLILLIQRLD